MCIECDKVFNNKNLSIEEIKKYSKIQTDLIKGKRGKWYRCYCAECGRTEIYFI